MDHIRVARLDRKHSGREDLARMHAVLGLTHYPPTLEEAST
ncbi:hypothetical protein RI444_08940 [Paenarthrobacter sp. AT5]|nr:MULTISPECIES: hypothetical protein [Paenarthrobacter]WOC62718.1 hypothetical protein RI444_08940 [Paenarthrobacter sp. AT5]